MSVLKFNRRRDLISQVVTIKQDNIVERDEYFSCKIRLLNGEDAASMPIFQRTATVMIRDSDGKFTI